VRGQTAFTDVDEAALRDLFEAQDYVPDDEIVTSVLLALRLGKPLLVEGEPGSGKTELGTVLAEGFDTDLVRLQCYEGLTAEAALYEWNYAKQLLAIEAGEGGVNEGDTVFEEEYLLERPLLEALGGDDESDRPPVLLIDEIDRADEDLAALLLELLSDFQVTIPELGTVSADRPPVVVITSNRTRSLGDALKRRCLYLHVGPPSVEKEREIVRRKVPELDAAIAADLCEAIARLRAEPLLKRPGIAESLDWARAVATLREADGDEPLDEETIRATLGCLLKEAEDVRRVRGETVEEIAGALDPE
jgi:MoxR-like ATPase